MIALEVLGIVAIAAFVWVFGGTYLDWPVSLISGLMVVVAVVTVVLSVAYVTYMNRHSTAASESMLPVFLRLALSLLGLPCLYFVGKLVIWFAFASESDTTSGNLQLEIFTYALGALLLLVLWIYGRRIISIIRQRPKRA